MEFEEARRILDSPQEGYQKSPPYFYFNGNDYYPVIARSIYYDDVLLLTHDQVDALIICLERYKLKRTSQYIESSNKQLEKGRVRSRQRSRYHDPEVDDIRAKSRQSKIYIMRNLRNGFVKIGISSNPEHRERTLQSQEPEIKLLHSSIGTIDDEKRIHARFLKKRLRGEWFKLSEREIAIAIEMIAA